MVVRAGGRNEDRYVQPGNSVRKPADATPTGTAADAPIGVCLGLCRSVLHCFKRSSRGRSTAVRRIALWCLDQCDFAQIGNKILDQLVGERGEDIDVKSGVAVVGPAVEMAVIDKQSANGLPGGRDVHRRSRGGLGVWSLAIFQVNGNARQAHAESFLNLWSSGFALFGRNPAKRLSSGVDGFKTAVERRAG